MRRRSFLASPAAVLAPRLAAAQNAPGRRLLKFIPQADLALLDPIQSVAFVSRNHALMVYDTLWGWDADLKARPQMAEGLTLENDGKLATIRLREGLKFHDGEPVRGRDCVASIRRWATRDAFGQALLAATDELDAPDDRSIRFRLKKPFPLLPDALAKVGVTLCAMMPERHASLPSSQAVPEMVGSGPFRFVANERVAGSLNVYERNAAYVPRQEAPSYMAGGKAVHFDRVEWHTIPDGGTASAAMQRGEMDWWELPDTDLVPQLRRQRGLKVEILDPNGSVGFLRFNQLYPPFDSAAIRRIVLGAVNQADCMTAVAGEDRSMWHVPYGYFAPGGVMASDEGLDLFRHPTPPEAAKRALEAAGYKGEKVTFLAATDAPLINALAQVTGDLLKRIGMTVDFVATDWGSVTRRLLNQDPPDKGGWNAVPIWTAGSAQINPAANNLLRGHGRGAIFGWPTAPELERLRNAWFDTIDDAQRAALGRQMQRQALQDVPYVPLGQFFSATAYKRELTGMLKGVALFYGLKRG